MAGPILSTADIYREEQYRQRNMFETAAPPGGAISMPHSATQLTRLLTPSLISSLARSRTHSLTQLTRSLPRWLFHALTRSAQLSSKM